MEEVGTDLSSVEKRLEALEYNIMTQNGGLPDSMIHFTTQLDSLNQKIEVKIKPFAHTRI